MDQKRREANIRNNISGFRFDKGHECAIQSVTATRATPGHHKGFVVSTKKGSEIVAAK